MFQTTFNLPQKIPSIHNANILATKDSNKELLKLTSQMNMCDLLTTATFDKRRKTKQGPTKENKDNQKQNWRQNNRKCPSGGARPSGGVPNKLQTDRSGEVLFLPYALVGMKTIRLYKYVTPE